MLSCVLWHNPARRAIILVVRLGQMGIVCGCPFRKRKGGQYGYIRSSYIAAGYFHSVNIPGQQKQPQVTEKAIL